VTGGLLAQLARAHP